MAHLEVNYPPTPPPSYLGSSVCYLSLISQHIAKCSPSCPKSPAPSSFGEIEVMLTHSLSSLFVASYLQFHPLTNIAV